MSLGPTVRKVKGLYYIYPAFKKGSFSYIGRMHCRELSRYWKVFEVDESVLDGLAWFGKKKILLHPIFYVCLGDRPGMERTRLKRLEKLERLRGRLGGFEVADSDMISDKAVEVANRFDLLIVPSQHVKETFVKSGVATPIEVLPHGVHDELLKPTSDIRGWTALKIFYLKVKKGAKVVLYFLPHSGFRKGADIAYEAMKRVQSKMPNAYLVVKKGEVADPYVGKLRKLKTVEVSGWLDWPELRDLYDVADCVIVPSRGGGFELNALEAVARGIPTVVPDAPPFAEMGDIFIKVPVRGKVKVFEDNPIHVGYGYEVDPEEYGRAILRVLQHEREYKERYVNIAIKVRKEYNWRVIGLRLFNILKKYGFEP